VDCDRVVDPFTSYRLLADVSSGVDQDVSLPFYTSECSRSSSSSITPVLEETFDDEALEWWIEVMSEVAALRITEHHIGVSCRKKSEWKKRKMHGEEARKEWID
ncbi:hypothetical protein PMAYCL1PPCAC_17259, partial [Pristionchus mayeri]